MGKSIFFYKLGSLNLNSWHPYKQLGMGTGRPEVLTDSQNRTSSSVRETVSRLRCIPAHSHAPNAYAHTLTCTSTHPTHSQKTWLAVCGPYWPGTCYVQVRLGQIWDLPASGLSVESVGVNYHSWPSVFTLGGITHLGLTSAIESKLGRGLRSFHRKENWRWERAAQWEFPWEACRFSREPT